MTTAEVWILIAAIAAVLLVALVAGYALNKRRRISLTPEVTEAKELTDRSGGYQAASGFSFSQGASAPEREQVPATKSKPVPLPPERTDDEGQPHIGDDAAIPRDSGKRSIHDVRLPEPVQGPEPAPAAESVTSVAADTETEADAAATEADTTASAAAETTPTDAAVTPATDAPAESTDDAAHAAAVEAAEAAGEIAAGKAAGDVAEQP
ncbi:signal recognition particle-docking protein FtsY, partial [Nocardia sp. NPDC059764]